MANAEEALRPNQVAAAVAAAGATELLLLFAFFHNSHISLCVHIYIYINIYHVDSLFQSLFALSRWCPLSADLALFWLVVLGLI